VRRCEVRHAWACRAKVFYIKHARHLALPRSPSGATGDLPEEPIGAEGDASASGITSSGNGTSLPSSYL
jgi:hypothetical protein